MTRLTVVTDRDALAASLASAFEVAASPAEPRDSLVRGTLPDAFLVDAEGLEHRSLVEFLTESTGRPTVVLVQEPAPDCVAAYLDSGADAVVRAGESLAECVARVRALTRRAASEPAQETSYRFGDVVLYPDRRSVLLRGNSVHFTRTEFNLLETLAQRLDQVTTHRHLMREVWGQEYLSARHYLRVYVRRVREKIEADANRPQLLISYRAKGYMLRATPQRAPVQAHADETPHHRGGARFAGTVGEHPYVPSLAG